MSWFKTWGGESKTGVTAIPQNAIQSLREMEERLTKKSDFLEDRIQKELATAKQNGTKNKRGV